MSHGFLLHSATISAGVTGPVEQSSDEVGKQKENLTNKCCDVPEFYRISARKFRNAAFFFLYAIFVR